MCKYIYIYIYRDIYDREREREREITHMCICVCMCVYIYIYIYVHIICIYTYIGVYMYTKYNYGSIIGTAKSRSMKSAEIPVRFWWNSGEILEERVKTTGNPQTNIIGKLNLSCGAIAVNRCSHQVIVFEWAHLKTNHLIGKLSKIITLRDSCQSPI